MRPFFSYQCGPTIAQQRNRLRKTYSVSSEECRVGRALCAGRPRWALRHYVEEHPAVKRRPISASRRPISAPRLEVYWEIEEKLL